MIKKIKYIINKIMYKKTLFKKEDFNDYDNEENYFNEEIENVKKNILFYNMEQKRNDEDDIHLLENLSILTNCLMIFFTVLSCFFRLKILVFFAVVSVLLNVYLFFVLNSNRTAYYKKWTLEDKIINE